MFNNTTPFTMPVAPASGGCGNNGMFGNDGGWWVLIILFALFGGWGGNGYGGFGGYGGRVNEGCATQADVRAAVDQQTLISKLDQQTYGLADSTYALNNAITNGFHGVDNAVCNLGYNVQNGFNALAHQISDCCCTTQRAIDTVRYDLATQACDTRQVIQNSTRDILESNNANTRAILDFLTQDKIATLTAENQNLKLAASQVAQNNYLLSELKPCPQPAYITCNPFTGQYGGYGLTSGCGCA